MSSGVLYVMRGLPASGKSTRAEELVKGQPNTVRVNRDLIRTMLHFGVWSGKRESATMASAKALVRILLGRNSDVVIDETNLAPKTFDAWKAIGLEMNARVQVMDFTSVPVETCVDRDAVRPEGQSVGAHVIRNMALRAGLKTFEYGEVVLCDVDGTIADTRHRLHHLLREDGHKDWKAFFDAAVDDAPRVEIVERLRGHVSAGRRVIFMSGRPDTYQAGTREWLDREAPPYYTLIMRRGDDRRDDDIVKTEMFNAHFPDKTVIHEVLDDRPRVIRAWQALGLPVVDVGDGVEF